MSKEEDKFRKSRRIHRDEVAIRKQVKIAKTYCVPVDEEHKLHKMHAMNCGNPNCVMCGNPRKVWGEETIQEKKFKQPKYWEDLDD